MVMTGLPRAAAISKPHDYKQNVQKMKGLLKKWALTGNSLKISNQNNQRIQSSYGEQNKRTARPWRQKLKMNHVARKKLTEAKLKKAFRIKLFGLCKTRTKKSSPDLFNFYVISAGHDMANDAGRAIMCRRSFKAPSLQTERTKNEGPSEKTSFNGEQFEIFKPKSQNFQSSYGEQNKKTTRSWRRKLNMNHVARKKLTEAKLKKAFRIKLFELFKTRTNKSFSDQFIFHVVLTGHDMVKDTGRVTTCRRNFRAPWLQTERTKNEGPSEKMSFNEEQFEDFRQKISKIPLLPWRTNQKNHKTPRAKTEHEPYNQAEINWIKVEKSIQKKTVRTLQDQN